MKFCINPLLTVTRVLSVCWKVVRLISYYNLVEAHASYVLNKLQKSFFSNIRSNKSTFDAGRFDPKVFVNCEVLATCILLKNDFCSLSYYKLCIL